MADSNNTGTPQPAPFPSGAPVPMHYPGEPDNPWPVIQSTPSNEGLVQELQKWHGLPGAQTLRFFKGFSAGFKDGFGDDPVGLSSEDAKKMQDLGLLAKDGQEPTALQKTFKALNESQFIGGARLLASIGIGGAHPFDAIRAMLGAYKGAQGGLTEAGVPADVASLPDAFLGDMFGIPKVPEGARAIEAESLAKSPGEAAKKAYEKTDTANDIAQAASGEPSPEAPKGITLPAVIQGRELGVIGPEKPSVGDMTRSPAEVARQAVAGDGAIKPPTPEDAAWQARFNKFVDKLETPDDYKSFLKMQAASDPEFFEPARRGEVPLHHVESLWDLTGVPPEEMTMHGIGRMMTNDAETRTSLQILTHSLDDVFEKARTASVTGKHEDEMAVLNSVVRQSQAMEQIVGLRAEWGRTGNVFQEFQEKIKDAQSLGRWLKDNRGTNLDDFRDTIKKLGSSNSREQVAKMLYNMRKPTFGDKAQYYYANGLLAGPFSHARYILGNTAFATYDAMINTPVAGAIGAVRQAFSKEQIDRVFIGEGPARMWGMIRGTENAAYAAGRAFKTGVPTPLPREIALNKNQYTGQNPIGGVVGTALGLPSRSIGAIHSFYSHLGYQAEIEAQAYRSAAKAGFHVTDPEFWNHMSKASAYPTEEAMDAAVKNGGRITFTEPLGKTGQWTQTALNQSKVGKYLVPFFKVSANNFNRARESTPLLAWSSQEMRADLLGKNGDIARDNAWARQIAGAAVTTMFGYWAVNDMITDGGPVDPAERRNWLIDHKPYSVRLGDHWVSYNRFGPLGPFLGMVTGVVGALKEGVNEGDAGHAIARLAFNVSHSIMNEIGLQSIGDLIEASRHGLEYGKRYLNDAGSDLVPYVSGLRQWASMMDPYIRETHNMVEALKAAVTPGTRKSLEPKIDWLGRPVENPRGGPGGAIFGISGVEKDPVALEAARLNVSPAPPRPQIDGVPLTERQTTKYNIIVGQNTYFLLKSLMDTKAYQRMPDAQKQDQFMAMIKTGRSMGGMLMKMDNGGELFQKGLEAKMNQLQGVKPNKHPSIGKELGLEE